MALEYSLPFFGVSTIAQPFFDFLVDAVDAHCLLLEVFPLVSGFVGLHFLEGDFCFKDDF